MSNRNKNLDILKGIAVIAVLLGHAIQRGLIVNYLDVLVFKIIYTFHMPLFMILSGYALKKFTKKINFNTILKKFCRLIIPTFIWSFIIYFVRNFDFVGIKEFIPFPDGLVAYTKTLIKYPTFIIWFLYVVFFCSIILLIQNKIMEKKDNLLKVEISILIAFLLFQFNTDLFGYTTIKFYFPIFALGYYIVDYLDIIKKYLNYMVIPAVIGYLILFKYFNYGYSVNMVSYLIAICSAIIIYYLVLKLKNNFIKNILVDFGEKSMEIYLCQCLCLNIGIMSGWVRVVSIFVSATLISYILATITKRNKYLSMLFYGNFNLGGLK